jgi:hypothetical protein
MKWAELWKGLKASSVPVVTRSGAGLFVHAAAPFRTPPLGVVWTRKEVG